MKNKLQNLNDILFAELERLSDEDLTGDELKQEIARSEALGKIAQTTINNAQLSLDAAVSIAEWNIKSKIPLLNDSEEITR